MALVKQQIEELEFAQRSGSEAGQQRPLTQLAKLRATAATGAGARQGAVR